MTEYASMTQKDGNYPGLTGNIATLEFASSSSLSSQPTALALHGWLDNAASFTPLAKHLVDLHWLAMDFPGHGLSQHRPASTLYHMTDYVADVRMVVDAMATEPIDLIGHSLGAGIACLLAAVCPQLIRRVVLIDGLGPLTATPDQAPQQLKKSLDAQQRLSALQESDKRRYPSWDHLIAARLRASQLSELSAAELMRRSAYETSDGISVRSDQRLKSPSSIYMSEPQVEAFLCAIEVPVLLIIAQQGVLINRPSVMQRIDYFKNMQVQQLPGGHHLHMDDPQPVAELIEAFLR